MEPILDGISEIRAHVRSNLCYLIYSWHLIRLIVVTNRIFFSEKTYLYLHACTTCSDLQSKLGTIEAVVLSKLMAGLAKNLNGGPAICNARIG